MTTVDRNIAEAERIFNYVWTDKAFCAEAAQMAAPQAALDFNGGCSIIQSNKRLAVLGNSVLSLVLSSRQLPVAWDAARQQILSNIGLDQRGRPLGIGDIIITEAGHYGPVSTKMIATTFEAMFGAIYQDGGEAAVIAAVEHLGFHNHPSLMVMFNTSPLHTTP
ncbi:hypothetical protein J1614_001444 [Plenodomus biglobosus]|nr:hypothetical protein J1614_001444 [Plenodomus biglobosus]